MLDTANPAGVVCSSSESAIQSKYLFNTSLSCASSSSLLLLLPVRQCNLLQCRSSSQLILLFLLLLSHLDMTFAVAWALKTNYLSFFFLISFL